MNFDCDFNNLIVYVFYFQMLLLIGEAFEETDLINGVVVNIRKMEKIGEWEGKERKLLSLFDI